ncbi:MAG: MFS transporter [Candidatus Hodarchaeota archaeon]
MFFKKTNETDYSPFKGQKVWWSSLELGNTISTTVLDTFLVAFYIFQVLNAYTGEGAIIRSALVGAVIFIGKIIQGLANIPIAQISDKIQTRWGRRRIFMLLGCIPWALSVFMLFGGPFLFSNIFLVNTTDAFFLGLIWLTFWFFLYNIFNAVVINPYLAMIPEIAKTSTERTNYLQIRGLFLVFGVIIGAILWPILEPETGALLVTLIMVITALTTFLGSREDPLVKPTTLSLKESINAIFQNKAFRKYIVTLMGWRAASDMLLALLPIIAVGMFNLDVNSQEIIPWLGIDSGIFIAILSGIFIVTSILMIPFVGRLQEKIGKEKAFLLYMFTLTLFIASFSLLGLFPGTPPNGTEEYFQFLLFQFFISTLFIGFPVGGMLVLVYSVFSDVIDNDPLKDAEKRESMYFAVQGLLGGSAASIGSLTMGITLAIFGSSDFGGVKDAGLLGTGSLGIRVVAVIAALIMLLASWFFRKYPSKVD